MPKYIIFLMSFGLAFSSRAATDLTHFKDELKKIEKKFNVKESDLGLRATIGEGNDMQVLFEENPTRMMIPASISKVATTSAVLAHFPPGFKFKTQLLSAASVTDGVLKGDLYLRGGGDPSFVSEQMWFLVNAFTRNKITKIEGNLIVDDSLFDQVRFDASRQKERVDHAYDAPVGAMSFNWNSVNIFVRPGKKGGAAQVFVDPENDYIRLVNNAKTVSGSENKLAADRKEDSKFEGDVIHVSGNIGSSLSEIPIYRNVTDPALWSGYNLRAFLSQRGIQVTGEIKIGVTPEKAEVLATAESKAIEQILSDMNKFSNNYVAEMLTKDLGALNTHPSTLKDGMNMINEHMKNLQLPEDQYHLESPSGLTRANKISPYAMWKILKHLRNDFQVQPEFLTSLPIAGVDGTLKKRMKNSPAERWVRAKTGSINNVVSIAGYAGLADGRVITFAFIYNGSTDETKVRAFFDNLLVHLVE